MRSNYHAPVQDKAAHEENYQNAVLKNFGNQFWFVFTRDGRCKVAVCNSKAEAVDFVDKWESNYEY